MGQVVGDFKASIMYYYAHGFRWYNGTLTDILTLQPYNPYSESHAYGINDQGILVGWGTAPYDTSQVPFKWENGVYTILSTLYGSSYGHQAIAINNANRIVGYSQNSLNVPRAAVWDNSTTVQEMFSLAGADPYKASYAYAVNNNGGRIVGKSKIGANNSTYHAFRTSLNSSVIQPNFDDLGTIPGGLALDSEAMAINDVGPIENPGEVVGGSVANNGQYHAFWKAANTGLNDGFVDLGVLPGHNYSVALGINQTGHIVGYSKGSGGNTQRAFISYNNGTMVDLNTALLNGAGWTLYSAEAINNNGWIVGWGLYQSEYRAFVLTPPN
jgi:probable HAF family extracellular repeat protein